MFARVEIVGMINRHLGLVIGSSDNIKTRSEDTTILGTQIYVEGNAYMARID